MAIHACRKRRLPVSRSMRQWLRSLSLTVIVSVLVARTAPGSPQLR